jgi:hypothetical protein
MIWCIIGLTVLIVLIVKLWVDDWWDLDEKIGFSLAYIIVTFLATFLVWFGVSGVMSICTDLEYVKDFDTQIIALKDNQNVNGRFYIMGGYVDEELYYYYAKETEFGYKTEKIEASKAYIKYTDEKPHIERYTAEFPKDFLHVFGNPIGERYVIYCPENTITTEFAVDLE